MAQGGGADPGVRTADLSAAARSYVSAGSL